MNIKDLKFPMCIIFCAGLFAVVMVCVSFLAGFLLPLLNTKNDFTLKLIKSGVVSVSFSILCAAVTTIVSAWAFKRLAFSVKDMAILAFMIVAIQLTLYMPCSPEFGYFALETRRSSLLAIWSHTLVIPLVYYVYLSFSEKQKDK